VIQTIRTVCPFLPFTPYRPRRPCWRHAQCKALKQWNKSWWISGQNYWSVWQ